MCGIRIFQIKIILYNTFILILSWFSFLDPSWPTPKPQILWTFLSLQYTPPLTFQHQSTVILILLSDTIWWIVLILLLTNHIYKQIKRQQCCLVHSWSPGLVEIRSGMALGVALVKAAIWFKASAPQYLNGGVMQHTISRALEFFQITTKFNQGFASLPHFVLQNPECVSDDKSQVRMSLSNQI